MGEDQMNNFMQLPMKDAKACRHPCCAHSDNEYSAIANRGSRRDILDVNNGQAEFGAAPGATGNTSAPYGQD
jgi:hypothetical protein